MTIQAERKPEGKPELSCTIKDVLAIVRDIAFVMAVVVYAFGFVVQYAYLQSFGLNLSAPDVAPSQLLVTTFETFPNNLLVILLLVAATASTFFIKYLKDQFILAIVAIVMLYAGYYFATISGHNLATKVKDNGCAVGDIDRFTTLISLKPEAYQRTDPMLRSALNIGNVRIIDQDDQNIYIYPTLSRMQTKGYTGDLKGGLVQSFTVALRKDEVIGWSVQHVGMNDVSIKQFCEFSK